MEDQVEHAPDGAGGGTSGNRTRFPRPDARESQGDGGADGKPKERKDRGEVVRAEQIVRNVRDALREGRKRILYALLEEPERAPGEKLMAARHEQAESGGHDTEWRAPPIERMEECEDASEHRGEDE